MRAFSRFLPLFVLLFAVTLFADDYELDSFGTARCTVTGTWIGGSDPATPYMMTIAPAGGGRYTAIFQLAVPAMFEPYLGITTWSGDVVRVEAGKYEVWAVLIAVWDPVWAAANGIDPSLPELHAVHSAIQFTDCNAVTNTIDLYEGYLNFNYSTGMVPFVTPPDWSALTDGATIDEVYYRVPSTGDHSRIPHRQQFNAAPGKSPVDPKMMLRH